MQSATELAGDALAFLLAEPVLLEVPILLVLVAVCVWRDRRSARRAEAIRAHGALDDLFLGIEAWCTRDAATTVHRLGRALEADPGDHSAARLLAEARLWLEPAPPAATSPAEPRGPGFPADRRFREEAAAVAAWLAMVPELQRRIEEPRRVLDALELNRAHLARLVTTALDGEAPALVELAELGGVVAGELLRQALTLAPDDRRAVVLAVSLGKDLFRALLTELEAEPSEEHSAQRARASRFALTVAIALGPAAEEGLDAAARSTHAVLRDLALDAAIAMGSADRLASRARVTSAGEVRRAIRRARPEQLASLARELGDGDTAFDAILDDPRPALWRALVDGAHEARAAKAWHAALRRGSTLDALAPVLAAEFGAASPPHHRDLLIAAGPRAAEPIALLATDPAASDADRAAARSLLAELGDGVVGALARTWGRAPSPADEHLVAAWSALGTGATAALRELFAGILREPDRAARAHRGALVIRALAKLGTTGARRVLDAARRQTTAPELARLAGEALAANAASARATRSEGRP